MSLDGVARAAGVGVGTLYRRFGGRDALVSALRDEALEGVCAVADRAARVDDPRDALRTLLVGLFELRSTDRAVDDVLAEAERPVRDRHAAHPDRRTDVLRDTIAGLLASATVSGAARPGFVARDVSLLVRMAGAVLDVPSARSPEPGARLRATGFLLDGALWGRRSAGP
jgi:AcrR family transcriptional regulator